MTHSLNEIERICQKATEGAGAPAGLDRDAAKGAAWLLAHELPALADLADDLSRFADLAAACRFAREDFRDQDHAIDASQKAGAVVAPLLIDLLVARATRDGGPGRLRVEGLTAPLFLLPPAAGHAEAGLNFRLDLSAGEQRRTVRIGAAGGVDIKGTDGDRADLFGARTVWSLDAVCAADPMDHLEENELARPFDGARLDAAYRRSLAAGVSPDPEAWARLQALATKVLVPATEQSHLMGAGSLASDNE